MPVIGITHLSPRAGVVALVGRAALVGKPFTFLVKETVPGRLPVAVRPAFTLLVVLALAGLSRGITLRDFTPRDYPCYHPRGRCS